VLLRDASSGPTDRRTIKWDRMESARRVAFRWFGSAGGALPAAMTLYAAAVIAGLLLVLPTAYGPIHFNDENLYWDMAQQMVRGGLAIAGANYPPAYPAALLPAFWWFFPRGTYAAAKLLNLLYLSSGVIPFFLLVDRLAGRVSAWAASVVLLLSPVHLMMPRVILSENLFYPLFLWAALLAVIDLAPRRRGWCRVQDGALGAVLGLMFLTRFIALPLIPAFLIVWWLKVRSQAPTQWVSRAMLQRATLLLLPLGGLVGGWLAAGIAQDAPLAHLLGFSIESTPNPAQLTLSRLALWGAFYVCYVALVAAPFLGVLLPGLPRPRDLGHSPEQRRWLNAVVLIGAALLVACVRHSWRANENYPEPSIIAGRYLLYFVPLLLATAFVEDQRLRSRPLTWSRWLGVVLASGGAAAVAYAVLFKGFLFLEHPLHLSINSPEGYVVESLGGKVFVSVCLAIVAATAALMGRDRRAALAALALGLVVLYGMGDQAIYRTRLLPWQAANVHIKAVGDLLAARDEYGSRTAFVTARVPTGTTASKVREMSSALWMREAIAGDWGWDEALPKESILVVSGQGMRIEVRRVQQSGARACRGEAYRFLGRDFCAELEVQDDGSN